MTADRDGVFIEIERFDHEPQESHTGLVYTNFGRTPIAEHVGTWIANALIESVKRHGEIEWPETGPSAVLAIRVSVRAPLFPDVVPPDWIQGSKDGS